jgi:hypothetical protein
MVRARLFALAALAAGALGAAGQAAEPHGPFPPYLVEPGYYADLLDRGAARLSKVEAVEMLSAIARGSDLMGADDAWFHPAKSRYGWEWLARRHGKGTDGAITAKEFAGPAKLFERLDRDGDGQITAADFDWSERSPYVRQLQEARQLLRALGADRGGKITRQDWDRTFERLSREKGFVTPEDLRERLFPPPEKPQGPPPAGPSPAVLFQGVLAGDLGSLREGPDVGGRAPDFRLKTYEGDREISLSDLRGKPVVLVFGSFT